MHHLKLGDPTDDGLLDRVRESVGVARHTSLRKNVPFVAFAGPWAEWHFRSLIGESEDMELWDWLELDYSANDYGDPLSDYALMDYDNLSDAQVDEWDAELEQLWLVIKTVTAIALAGGLVNTDVVKAAIGQRSSS